MNVIKTRLAGVLIIEPQVFGDHRGFFLETYRAEDFQKAGITKPFVQDNHSRSQKGVLRGLHYQLTQPQGKLVRVSRGKVFDVAVDVRPESPTFGQWESVILDDETHKMFYVPPGYAHGFCVLSDEADFTYKCTDYYHPQSEQGIAWDDPEIGIEWPEMDYTLSEKDKCNPKLSEQSKGKLPLFKG